MTLETVKVKLKEHGNADAIINKSDYDPKLHTLQGDDARKMKAAERGTGNADADAEIAKAEALRKHEANRGIEGGTGLVFDGKNPDGTYSEPTPSDIRYPNKDATEFANNHGAFVRKSAAQMREDQGLPDAPGGLHPIEIPADYASQSVEDQRALYEKLGGRDGATLAPAQMVAFIATAQQQRTAAMTQAGTLPTGDEDTGTKNKASAARRKASKPRGRPAKAKQAKAVGTAEASAE
jgi:hypothetical protein